LASVEHRPSQQKRIPEYRQEHPRGDLSNYRPHQTRGYEIYEDSDLPTINVQQSSFREHSSGNTRLLDPAISEGSVNYQKQKSAVRQIYHGKPTGLSVTEGLTEYPYAIVRPQGEVRNHRKRLSVPGVMLAYQGNSGVPPNSHASLSQYALLTCTDATGHTDKCQYFCCSPANQIPIIPT
jgi:hypothetical protein